MLMMSEYWILLFTIAFFSCLPVVTSQPFDFPTANLSTSWVNSISANHSMTYSDNSTVRAILLRGTFGPRYSCGFYCSGDCTSYLFAIFIVQTSSGGFIVIPGFPQVVWSANRKNPVRIDSVLELTSEGDLVLRDADGSVAWSTNTTGKGVVGLNLTEVGNLVLFDANKSVVWQSFDHPTDCLVPGQILVSGMSLTASSNWSEEGGLISLSVTEEGLVGSVQSDPPQIYYQNLFSPTSNQESYADFRNGSLALYRSSNETSPDITIPIPSAASSQYMKLGQDGNLRVFEWAHPWKEVFDLLTGYGGDCSYPMVCGRYAICSSMQCTCPGSSFRQKNDRRPDLGCSQIIPLTCNASDNQTFLDLNDATYFTFASDIKGTDVDRCKEACLKNCSCKAAVFRYYGSNSTSGDCYLPTEVFSLMSNEKDVTLYNSSVSLKVQIAAATTSETNHPKGKKTSSLGLILGSSIGVSLAVAIIGTILFVMMRRRRETEDADEEEDHLDHIPGMPTRFSFEELAAATNNFSKKLGEGGYGSVYEGLLRKEKEKDVGIAVKRLDGVGHIKKSFLAEVESIGSIHHVNLVRLIGFCAEKSHRLLVYEFMCNGSLDKWIYSGRNEATIDWNVRRRVILDIAKGLTYLHEECRQKILHLDIKPQNILLDEHFNAKLADFGLSKLIDRNQSKVVATFRGTPGYIAPEWLSSVITDKVDVYSFGMVVLEMLTGRRIFEQSRAEEDRHLLTVFVRKREEGKWLDLVDECCRNVGEVERMMQISAWCLQSGYEKRPTMSMAMKVLEGVMEVPGDVDFRLLIPHYLGGRIAEGNSDDEGAGETPLLPSLLSGPR